MKKKKLPFTLMLAALAYMTSAGNTFADEHTWTLDADFDQGTIVNLNHDPNHDQLQLNNFAKPFRFINVAASGRGTVVRIDTDTGEIVGEYRTASEFRGLSSSRTTVDIVLQISVSFNYAIILQSAQRWDQYESKWLKHRATI